MTNKLLIIGARGMLGHALAEVFGDRKAVLWDKAEIDISNKKEVQEKILGLKPAIVINAAAYTDVDACEKNRELAFAVNGHAVGYLAETVQKTGATLVHYSTDYVFEGKNPEGYREDDEPAHPINVYGESKLLGEKLLTSVPGLHYYCIRTSWLFGEHGKNFIQTMLELAKTKDEILVVNDQHGKPTYAKDLAASTRELFEKQYPGGVYHVVNEPATTWFDFARAIFKTYAASHPEFTEPRVLPCDTARFPRPARRPAFSALLNTKLAPLRPWQNALKDYLAHDAGTMIE